MARIIVSDLRPTGAELNFYSIAEIDLSLAEMESVTGGMFHLFVGGALVVGALLLLPAIIYDNSTDGNLAGSWYRMTKP